MPDSLKTRIERALKKLNIRYQDVSDPEDATVSAAYFADMATERGARMPVVVSVSRAKNDVWVQGGIDPVDIADLADATIVSAIDAVDTELQQAPASLFSQHKLPRFRARGFSARVSWSPKQRRVVSTVIMPLEEFSSATLQSSIDLAAHLAARANARVLAASTRESSP